MKRTSLFLKIILIFSLTMSFTGCIVDECKCGRSHDCTCPPYGETTNLTTLLFTVNVDSWWWNPSFGRFEYMFDAPKITNTIYANGLVHAGVFIKEMGTGGKEYEVLKMLPFVQTYPDGDTYTYTETISYDISPGSIMFTIQCSDLYTGDEFLQTYEFKVSILY